jgi:hypothetical protein
MSLSAEFLSWIGDMDFERITWMWEDDVECEDDVEWEDDVDGVGCCGF